MLIDIINQEKHGYPLKQSNRSGKNPLIQDVKKAFRMTLEEGAETGFNISSEWVLTTEGDVRTCIVADITNGDALSMFGLDELVDTCYSKLDAFALKHKCY